MPGLRDLLKMKKKQIAPSRFVNDVFQQIATTFFTISICFCPMRGTFLDKRQHQSRDWCLCLSRTRNSLTTPNLFSLNVIPRHPSFNYVGIPMRPSDFFCTRSILARDTVVQLANFLFHAALKFCLTLVLRERSPSACNKVSFH